MTISLNKYETSILPMASLGSSDTPAVRTQRQLLNRLDGTSKALATGTAKDRLCHYERHFGGESCRFILGEPIVAYDGEAARSQGLPIEPHRLTPEVNDTFSGQSDWSWLSSA